MSYDVMPITDDIEIDIANVYYDVINRTNDIVTTSCRPSEKSITMSFGRGTTSTTTCPCLLRCRLVGERRPTSPVEAIPATCVPPLLPSGGGELPRRFPRSSPGSFPRSYPGTAQGAHQDMPGPRSCPGTAQGAAQERPREVPRSSRSS